MIHDAFNLAINRIGDIRREIYDSKYSDPEVATLTDKLVLLIEDLERAFAEMQRELEAHSHVETMRF